MDAIDYDKKLNQVKTISEFDPSFKSAELFLENEAKQMKIKPKNIKLPKFTKIERKKRPFKFFLPKAYLLFNKYKQKYSEYEITKEDIEFAKYINQPVSEVGARLCVLEELAEQKLADKEIDIKEVFSDSSFANFGKTFIEFYISKRLAAFGPILRKYWKEDSVDQNKKENFKYVDLAFKHYFEKKGKEFVKNFLSSNNPDFLKEHLLVESTLELIGRREELKYRQLRQKKLAGNLKDESRVVVTLVRRMDEGRFISVGIQ